MRGQEADILANRRQALSLVSRMSGLVCDKFTRKAEYKELGEQEHIIVRAANMDYKVSCQRSH